MLRKLGFTVLGVLSILGVAQAQYTSQSGGIGAGYPTLNVPADTQCTSYGNAGVCNSYAPAGPTAVTGYETFLADTHQSGGNPPQTINMPVTAIGGGVLQVEAPLTGATITLTAQTRQLIINPAGTIATLTVNMPAASATMVNGQRIGICGTQIVTALTLAGGTGNTFNPAVQTATLVPVITGAASCTEYIYSKTSATAGVWFRTQ